MNRLEREARNSAAPLERIVPVTYLGFKCRPAGRPRQKRHVWIMDEAEALFCERCGANRNPSAK